MGGYQQSNLSKVLENILSQPEKISAICDMAFRGIDKDGDETISKEELGIVLQNVASKMAIACPSENDLSMLLQELDQDDDGEANKEEFEMLILRSLEKMYKSERDLIKTMNQEVE